MASSVAKPTFHMQIQNIGSDDGGCFMPYDECNSKNYKVNLDHYNKEQF